MFCNAICSKVESQRLQGYFYNCEKCGRYDIDDDDRLYFESLSVEEKQWYASKLKETKESRPAVFAVGEWIPCSPRSWVRIDKKGQPPIAQELLCNGDGKYRWRLVQYDTKLHSN